ncbi:hypothetical protein [Calothrix sp. CCY 0018]|uniref:hypothetical protein n=1 Tax=Calothrix sp. CCY 0018 TaxID=3103864 RepID=UPI0039C6BF61
MGFQIVQIPIGWFAQNNVETRYNAPEGHTERHLSVNVNTSLQLMGQVIRHLNLKSLHPKIPAEITAAQQVRV